jgi:CheY-like chemotaxis protein
MTTQTRYKVLVVDDDPGALFAISGALSVEFEVTPTLSPLEALQLLQTQDFQVVCADFQMPQMNGLALLQTLGALPQYTAGLLITGSNDVMSHKDWSDTKRVGVVFKPYDPEQLIRVVRQFAKLAEMKRKATPR